MKSIYECYIIIGLFGTYFNLILDKKSFIRESILEMRHQFLVVGRYKVFKQMSLIFMSLFKQGRQVPDLIVTMSLFLLLFFEVFPQEKSKKVTRSSNINFVVYPKINFIKIQLLVTVFNCNSLLYIVEQTIEQIQDKLQNI